MAKALTKKLALAAAAPALAIGLAASPAQAHNDWALPLVGGLVGGYGLSTLMHRHQEQEQQTYSQPAPTYVAAPAPAAPPSAASTAANIEHQLNVLDDLAAKGYITQQEYQSRRQALLNQL